MSGIAIPTSNSLHLPIRPRKVLELRGQKLELQLLDLAEQQAMYCIRTNSFDLFIRSERNQLSKTSEVDEFIIGLPKSFDGKETPQSNKDEHRTSAEAMDLMLDMSVSKGAHQEKIDAYAAMMVLERDFSLLGHGIEIDLPKQLELQEKLRRV